MKDYIVYSTKIKILLGDIASQRIAVMIGAVLTALCFFVPISFIVFGDELPEGLFLHTALITLLLQVCFLFFIGFLLLIQKRKWDRDIYEEREVILINSELADGVIFRLFSWLMRRFLRKEKAVFQKCRFYDGEQEDWCLYLLTRQRAESLKKICFADVQYYDLGTSPKSVRSFQRIPVKICVGQQHHYMRSLMPAENHCYALPQKDALAHFNRGTLEYDDFCSHVSLLVCLAPLMIVLLSFLFPLCLYGLLGMVILPEYALFAFLVVTFIFGWMDWTLYPVSKLLESDAKKEATEVCDILLTDTFCPYQGTYVSSSRLSFVRKKHYAVWHQAQYVKMTSEQNRCSKKERLFVKFTSESVKPLIHLYDAEIRFHFGSLSNSLKCKAEIPIRAEFGKTSRVLLSIAPVEGYSYTEAQLTAIEKFNALYP